MPKGDMTTAQFRNTNIPRAKGHSRGQHKAGEMNGAEQQFAKFSDVQKLDGFILGWWFEQITFKLAPDCRYTPDFMWMNGDLSLEFLEVKVSYLDKATGKVITKAEDDSLVKIRMAANEFRMFTFKLAVLQPDKVSWLFKEY